MGAEAASAPTPVICPPYEPLATVRRRELIEQSINLLIRHDHSTLTNDDMTEQAECALT